MILRLLGAFNSNEFQKYIYPLNAAIREREIAVAVEEFDRTLMAALVDAGTITPGQYKRAQELFEYARFKGIAHDTLNFSKYILMRIDRYLHFLLDKPSFCDAGLADLESRFNRSGQK